MKKRIFSVWPAVVLLIALFASGCQEADKGKPTLSVSPSGEIVFSGDGADMTVDGNPAAAKFTVTCQGAWTATSDKRWVKVSLDGNAFTLSVDRNDEKKARGPAIVTVAAKDVEPVTIKLTQATLSVDAQYGRAAQILGRGYDVTGFYANSSAVKQAILSFPMLAEDKLVIRNPDYAYGDFLVSYGNSAEEFSQSLAQQASIGASLDVKGIVSFQSELSKRYSKEEYTRDEYAFALMRSMIGKDAYSLENRTRPELFRKYVTKEFLTDLRTQPPAEIINRYGTHVMLGGVWGARLEHHFSAKKKVAGYAESAGKSLEASLKVAYAGSGAGASTKLSKDEKYTQYYENSSGKTQTYVYGGKTQYGQKIASDMDYGDWLDSIDGDNIVWIDYYPESLYPIYMFVENAAHRDSLKKAYDEYLAGKNISVENGLKKKTVRKKFYLTGATKKERGDNAVYTQKGKKTDWGLDIKLEQSSTTMSPYAITPTFRYRVEEMQGDRTTLIMERSAEAIAVGTDFIFFGKDFCSSGTQTFVGKEHEFFNPKLPADNPLADCIDVSSLKIRIDSKDENDYGKIGIEGELVIPVGYIEYAKR